MTFDPMGHETPKGDIEALVGLFQSMPRMGHPERSTDRVIVEIGTWAGQSAIALEEHLWLGDRVFCVDDWRGLPGIRDGANPDKAYRTFCRNVEPYLYRTIFPIRMDSSLASDTWPRTLPVDFLFIDGDHSFEGCRADIVNWDRYVRDGGIVCGHDYTVGGVREAVESYYGTSHKVHNGNVWSVVKGKSA